MSVEDGLVMKGDCVYWSNININTDIESMINKCGVCQEMQRAQAREPLMQHDLPTRLWHTVGTYLFSIWQHSYLIVVDY